MANKPSDQLVTIALTMLGVAMVAVIVQSPYTANVAKAAGDVWTGSIKAIVTPGGIGSNTTANTKYSSLKG